MAKTYEVKDPTTNTVYGERSTVKEARKLAKKYEGAVVREKLPATIVNISFTPSKVES